MRTFGFCLLGIMITAVVATAWIAPEPIPEKQFALADYVPNDVFLYLSQVYNPERAFIDQYWLEVYDALLESGFPDEVIGLLNALLSLGNPKLVDEMERIRKKALELVKAVEWSDMGCREFAMAEQFNPPKALIKGRSPILMADIVWMFRGNKEVTIRNYEGLVDILEALADEVNSAVGREVLFVERKQREGATVTSIDILKRVPNTPSLPLSVALREDVIIIGLRETLFSNVLGLMNGTSDKKPLVEEARFQTAFKHLPEPETFKMFMDFHALLKPMYGFISTAIDAQNTPRDVYINAGSSGEVTLYIDKAMSAYNTGDYKGALAKIEQAYGIAPENCIVLYNLACFNALLGNREEALDWLLAAAEGGFHAPSKISSDSDLDSLRNDPKYAKAMKRAAELAATYMASDVVLNYTDKGEVGRLRMELFQCYDDQNFERGLEIAKQAYAIAPNDSKVIYGLGCLHSLLGHEEEALSYLEKSIEAGFYCPNHIKKDPDWENVRHLERFGAAIDLARKKAGQEKLKEKDSWASLAQTMLDRVAQAVGVLDYVASIETSNGYSTQADTVVMLVPDAKERPIYKIFGNRPQLTDFEKYLPEETASYTLTSGIDLGALYTFVKDTLHKAGKPGQAALAKWEVIQKQIGVNLHKDVLGWIDGDTLEMTLADTGDTVTMMKVTDEKLAREKMGALVEFVTVKLGDLYMKNRKLAGLAMLGLRTSDVHHDELEGFQNIHMAMSPKPFVWGVADGQLIFATSADAVALCLATARGEHPNIMNNDTIMKEGLIPKGPFTEASYSDLRGLGDQIAEGLGVATMITGMMGSFIPEPAVRPILGRISTILGTLTPVVQKIDFYKSQGSLTTFDGQKWINHKVTNYFSPEERSGVDKL